MMNVQKSTASSIMAIGAIVLLCIVLYSVVKTIELNQQYSDVALRTGDLTAKMSSLEEELMDSTLNNPYLYKLEINSEVLPDNSTLGKAEIPIPQNNYSPFFPILLGLFSFLGVVLIYRIRSNTDKPNSSQFVQISKKIIS